jgi:hypothetical protein
MNSYKPLVTAIAAALMITTLPAQAVSPDTTSSAGLDLSGTQWGITAVRAEQAWSRSKGSGVTVAVLDTGVDATHPDLAGRVTQGWSTYYERPLEVGMDNDLGSHGTHVAAIIAGDADGDGVNGVAPEVTILPVQVLGPDGATDAQVADGIDWAVRNGADIINMSLGGEKNIFDKGGNLSCAAVARAYEAGVVVVVAAGNSGGYGNPENRPASCRGAISVAALDENLDRAFFSNFDATVSVSAPGRRIVSAVPTSAPFPFDLWDGTSMAAPFVSGVAALILSVNPDMSVDEVTARLRNTAVDLGAPGVDPETGYGLVDAAAAVGLAPSDAISSRSSVRAVGIPRVTNATSDLTTTNVRWEAPVGTTVESYRIRHTSSDGTLTESSVPGDRLQGVIEADAWTSGVLVVIAVTSTGERVSFPFLSVEIEFPEIPTPPLPKVTKATGKWVEKGLEVTFKTTGPSGEVNVTLLDWEYGIAAELYVNSTKGKTLIPLSVSSEIRAHHSTLIVGNEGKRIQVDVRPQYLVAASVLTAGKGRIGVKGTTINSCFGDRTGCQGALVDIVDYKTNRKLGSARVLENLTFAVVIDRRPGTVKIVVVNGRHRTPALLVPAEGASK